MSESVRRAKLTETKNSFKLFVEIPKDGEEVAKVLRLVRDLAPSMPFGIDDSKVANSMQAAWIELEKRSAFEHFNVDPYKLARLPRGKT